MEHNYTVGEEFDPWGVTGFSCRVEASKPKLPPTTTAPPTTTTTTTTTTTPEPTTKPSNDTCPQPDPEMCRCGRIKQFPQFKSMKFGRVLQERIKIFCALLLKTFVFTVKSKWRTIIAQEATDSFACPDILSKITIHNKIKQHLFSGLILAQIAASSISLAFWTSEKTSFSK